MKIKGRMHKVVHPWLLISAIIIKWKGTVFSIAEWLHKEAKTFLKSFLCSCLPYQAFWVLIHKLSWPHCEIMKWHDLLCPRSRPLFISFKWTVKKKLPLYYICDLQKKWQHCYTGLSPLFLETTKGENTIIYLWHLSSTLF